MEALIGLKKKPATFLLSLNQLQRLAKGRKSGSMVAPLKMPVLNWYLDMKSG